MSEWQPIETVEKHGPVDLWVVTTTATLDGPKVSSGRVTDASYNPFNFGGWQVKDTGDHRREYRNVEAHDDTMRVVATHWMPVPQPPTT